MGFGELRIWAVAIVLAVALGALFGGYYLYEQNTVKAPLEQALAEAPGVKAFTLTRDGAVTRLDVELAWVDSLADTYAALDATAGRLLGQGYALRLIDRRDPFLERVYHQAHFALQEGIYTGRFTDMARSVDEIMAQNGVEEYRLTVTERHVFLQIKKGRAYLYEVIPRTEDRGGEAFDS